MATAEAKLNIDAFKEMKRIIQNEIKMQGLNPINIKKEIESELNDK
ncbi:hypothetical protein [Peribacillus phoenicis]